MRNTEVLPPFFLYYLPYVSVLTDLPPAKALKNLPEDQKHAVRQGGKRPAAEGEMRGKSARILRETCFTKSYFFTMKSVKTD